MNSRIVAVLLFMTMLIGCDSKTWFDSFIPQQEAEFARNYFALLQKHDFDAVEARIDPALKNEQLRANLEHIASFFPSDSPQDVQAVGAQTISNAGITQVSLTFQYAYPDKWLLANVLLRKDAESTLVAGIHVRPLPASLEDINRFTFEGKGVTHYTVFLMSMAVPLVMVVALILCVKTPIPKRKWLWVLFILVGVMQVTLNWSDGSLNVTPVGFQLLGAGFWKGGPYAPWMLSVSFPLGAFVFLLKRKSYFRLNERDLNNQVEDV